MARTTVTKALLFVGLSLTLLSCSLLSPLAPESTATPTASKVAKRTRVPKRTKTPAVQNQPTATPSKLPKRTRVPKRTATPASGTPTSEAPFVTLTPSTGGGVPFPSITPTGAPPTAVPPTARPMPTAPKELDCQLQWQSPSNSIEFFPLDKFTTGWDVKNTGTATWEQGSVEFTYVGGAKLHNDPSFPLDTTVTPGDEIVLSVPMKAPRDSTKYTTYWALRQGDTFFCRLKLSIYVIEE